MPRFVLLLHDHPTLHCDLMLEVGPVLWTWRLQRPPDAEVQPAERIGDHRLLYLDYEGPVSGGRGEVKRIDRGEYQWIERSDERVVVELEGINLRGRMELFRREDAWRAQFFATAGRDDSAAARGSIAPP